MPMVPRGRRAGRHRPSCLALLVDLHVAIGISQVLGCSIVVGTALGHSAVVVGATELLFDERFVAVAVLRGGSLATHLAVLPDRRGVAVPLLGLGGLVFHAEGLAGEGVVELAFGGLGDGAAILRPLLGVTGVVGAGGTLLDVTGAFDLHGQMIVTQARLSLGGRGVWCQRLLDFGDVFGTGLGLVRGAVVSHDLAGQGQDDSGTERGELEHGGASRSIGIG